jgi:hypothetical protein
MRGATSFPILAVTPSEDSAMIRKHRHASTALATLQPEMPSLRRMPAPSRLPEFDLEGTEPTPAPRRRSSLLRNVLCQLTGWTRR